jgi:hypothetical protein
LAKQVRDFLAVPPTIAEIWIVGDLLVDGVRTARLTKDFPSRLSR